MYSLDSFIRENDKDNKVRKAIADCIAENMTKDVAIDTLADDLVSQLEGYLFDDGGNVLSGFKKKIVGVLTAYFGE